MYCVCLHWCFCACAHVYAKTCAPVASLFGTMAKRHRSKPNTQVGVDDYIETVTRWLTAPPLQSFNAKLGCKLAADARQVRPSSMDPLVSLLEGMMAAGCPGVINGTRLEQAICRMIGTMPERFDIAGKALAEFPNKRPHTS